MTYYTYNADSGLDTRDFKVTVNGETVGGFKLPTEYEYLVQDGNKKIICACKTQADQEFILKALHNYDMFQNILDKLEGKIQKKEEILKKRILKKRSDETNL